MLFGAIKYSQRPQGAPGHIIRYEKGLPEVPGPVLKNRLVPKAEKFYNGVTKRKREEPYMSNQRYSMEPPPLSLPVQLLYVTCARSDKDWHSMEHSHYFAELFFITKGEGSFIIDNKRVPVRENDLVLVNPGVSHTELGNKKSPWEYIALGIEGLQFHSGEESGPYDYSVHYLGQRHRQISDCLAQMVAEARLEEPDSGVICQKLLELLLLYITRHTRQNLLAAPPKKATRECRFVEQYINEHYFEEITLESLSLLAHINKYYLVHAFKAYKGISPISYLTQKRLSEAMHLLETTNYPVTKISGMVGYSSQSYFSQAFRRMTSMSPNQYRKRNEKKMLESKQETGRQN